MKYVVDIEGDLPAFGALAYAKPLITCGECKWRGPQNKSGYASCYWDTPPRKIYPRDFWCKLGETEEPTGYWIEADRSVTGWESGPTIYLCPFCYPKVKKFAPVPYCPKCGRRLMLKKQEPEHEHTD